MNKNQSGRQEDSLFYQQKCEELHLNPLNDVLQAFQDRTDFVEININYECQILDLQAICYTLMLIKRPTSLKIQDLKIGNQGLMMIADVLKKNDNIRVLSLRNTDITQSGIPYFCVGLTSLKSCLQELTITHSRLGADGVEQLCIAISRNTDIKKLVLNSLSLFDQSIPFIGNMLENTKTLEHLSIQNNGITQHGVYTLSRSLGINKSLNKLYLSGNPIGDEGFIALIDTFLLRFSVLELDYCKIGISSMDHFCKQLALPHMFNKMKIQILNFANNRITTNGVIQLFSNAVNILPLMRILNLANNKIGNNAMSFFREFLLDPKVNIEKVDLSQNNIDENGIDHIIDYLQQTTLECVDLSRNYVTPNSVSNFFIKLSEYSLEHKIILNDQLAKNSDFYDESDEKVSVFKKTDTRVNVSQNVQDIWSRYDNQTYNRSQTQQLTSLQRAYKNFVDFGQPLKEIKIDKGATISGPDIEVIGNLALNCETIHTIDLESTVFTNKDLTKLLTMLRRCINIKKVSLRDCKVAQQGCKILVDFLENRSAAIDIDLGENMIENEGFIHLLNHSKKTDSKLNNLVVDHNNITQKGVDGLVELFQEYPNNRIKEIQLDGNRIFDQGAKKLFNVIKTNNTVQELSMGNCGMTEASAEPLKEMLKFNNVIEDINLDGNAFQDQGADIILDGLVANKALKAFSIKDCMIGTQVIDEYEEALQYHVTLKEVLIEATDEPQINQMSNSQSYIRNSPSKNKKVRGGGSGQNQQSVYFDLGVSQQMDRKNSVQLEQRRASKFGLKVSSRQLNNPIQEQDSDMYSETDMNSQDFSAFYINSTVGGGQRIANQKLQSRRISKSPMKSQNIEGSSILTNQDRRVQNEGSAGKFNSSKSPSKRRQSHVSNMQIINQLNNKSQVFGGKSVAVLTDQREQKKQNFQSNADINLQYSQNLKSQMQQSQAFYGSPTKRVVMENEGVSPDTIRKEFYNDQLAINVMRTYQLDSLEQLNLKIDTNAKEIINLFQQRKDLLKCKQIKLAEQYNNALIKTRHNRIDEKLSELKGVQMQIEEMSLQDILQKNQFFLKAQTVVEILKDEMEDQFDYTNDITTNLTEFRQQNKQHESDIELEIKRLNAIDKKLDAVQSDIRDNSEALDTCENAIHAILSIRTPQNIAKAEPYFVQKQKVHGKLEDMLTERNQLNDEKLAKVQNILDNLNSLKDIRESRLKLLNGIFDDKETRDFAKRNGVMQHLIDQMENIIAMKKNFNSLCETEKVINDQIVKIQADIQILENEWIDRHNEEASLFQTLENNYNTRIQINKVVQYLAHEAKLPHTSEEYFINFLIALKDKKDFFDDYIGEDFKIVNGLNKTHETADSLQQLQNELFTQKNRKVQLYHKLQGISEMKQEEFELLQTLRKLDIDLSKKEKEKTHIEADLQFMRNEADLETYKKIGQAFNIHQNTINQINTQRNFLIQEIDKLNQNTVNQVDSCKRDYENLLREVFPVDWANRFDMSRLQDIQYINATLQHTFKRLGIKQEELQAY